MLTIWGLFHLVEYALFYQEYKFLMDEIKHQFAFLIVGFPLFVTPIVIRRREQSKKET
ncbi:hypothetical protein HY628_02815 [Candidatus Uhrbacteria bacterium]|nr:hypothetical protein [Candidatus Uhrbacteria bacterium]